MDDEIGLFREHDHVVVLEADVERDVLGLKVPAIGRRDLHDDAVPSVDDVPLVDDLAVDAHEAVGDEPGCC